MNDNDNFASISTTIDSNTISSDNYLWNWKGQHGTVINKDVINEWWRNCESNNKKGDENMRYLWEVILVNPKDDEFYTDKVVARSETSALMEVYKDSPFFERDNIVNFDDLKTSCRVLFEWKKKESLKKAIETIKKAVE